MIQSETLELLEWSRLCQHLSTFAATKLGAAASRNLRIPETKSESLNLLAQTQEVDRLEQNAASSWSFEGIKDIGSALERAALGGMLSALELLNIATTLAGVRKLRRVIEELETYPVLQELVAQVRTYPEIEREIHHCIDDRAEVADRASPQLGEIRSQLKSIRDRIYQSLQNILNRHPTAVQEAVITQRGDRFVIPVKATHKDHIPGIVHDTSSTGATLYVEPQGIVESGNRLRQYRRKEQVEEEAILTALSQQVEGAIEDLRHLLEVATTLDLATARARYGAWIKGNPPKFVEVSEGETITLRNLRHPLLIWQQKHEQGTDVIPINVQIKPEIRVVAITGPNTGGKTVTLKTLGLACLMAKLGLYIPAGDPVEIPWFSQILADIGDEQSLEQSLSTFSGHIRRIIRIIEALEAQKTESNPTSLVLLDEVGAGTDPAEGSALAIALLKYLADHTLLTIATTHYGELKALKYQDSRFENASVEFDENTLSPTYRLLWGIPGRSNALTIAKRLGLDGDIVEEARILVGGYSQEINEVIAGLEAQRREQEIKAKEASKLLEQTEQFYQEVSERALSLQEREKDLKLYQEREIQQALLAAKGEIANIIRTLQQGDKTGQNAQKATEALNHMAEIYLPKPDKRKPAYLPQVGEKVRILSLGQTAEVLGVNQEQSELTVRFGIMKMTLPLVDMESLDGKKVEVPAKQKPAPTPTVSKAKTPVLIRTSQNTIDLRGKRVADAEIDLDRGIQNALDYDVIYIIHGKGTGKLREGIQEFLRQHPQIKRYETAPDKEGGTGVTIAYLS